MLDQSTTSVPEQYAYPSTLKPGSPPAFQAIRRETKEAELRRYIEYHCKNLMECSEAGSQGGVEYYSDLLVEHVMRLRALGTKEGV